MTTCARIVRAFCLLLAMAAVLAPAAFARASEGESGPDTGPPSIAAVTVDQPPVVDATLDDPCWSQATHVEGFWRQITDAPELEHTEAWICCDDTAIYVAFRCHDSKPPEIRCDQKKRQGSMKQDDWVRISLDVEDAGRHQYEFQINPAGTQQDEVPGGTSEKIEWKGDWRAAAHIDDQGWTAEAEIPFAILRYPEGQQRFRFYLERQLAREYDRSVWPKCFARVADYDNCARWTDIVPPPVPFRYVLMPYLLSVGSEAEEDRETLTGGLDFKGTLPNGVVALATYNPDFSNIEDVVETIDFTFVERYLPEYRPFFQEGSGYGPYAGGKWSRGAVNLFYSRRIAEFDWGAKSFGTVGRHRFGLLDAYRRGGENHLVWNYERLFGTEGTLAFSGVDRRVPGEPDNLALGLGSRWNFAFPGGSRSFSAQWYDTQTQGDGGDDRALELDVGVWRDQGFGWWAGYSSVGDQFEADDGYVPEMGVRELDLGFSYPRSHDEGPLLYSEYYGYLTTGEARTGSRLRASLDHGTMWRNGWSTWASVDRGERDGFDVATNSLTLGWNRQDIYRAGGVGITWGERYGESYRYQSVSQAFRPGPRWSAKLTAERVYAAYPDGADGVVPAEWFRQLVLTSTYDVSEERSVSARLVRSGSNTNAYAAYRQRVRSGMDLLIVAGDPNADEWVSRLAVKAIWCF